MYMNLRFGILLVEPSFEFVVVLRSCVHVREIKTTFRKSASRPSTPLPLVSKFSRFNHRGSLLMLFSCNQKCPARISARTQTTLIEIVLAFPRDSRSTSGQQRFPSRSFRILLTSTFAHSGLRSCRECR